MKKYSVSWVVLTLGALLLFGSCEKDYYDPSEVIYSLSVPDTIYLNTPVTIKGEVNKPLDIRVYWEAMNDEHCIGILRSASDSIVWTPRDIEEGPHAIMSIVHVQVKRGEQHGLSAGWSVYVKKEPEEKAPSEEEALHD